MNQPTPSERRQEWVFSNRRGLVLCFALAAMAGLGVEDSSWLTGSGHWVWFQISAIALILYGESYRMWATWHIGGRKNQTIVETGPYAYSRNPLYVGSLFCVVGIGVMAASVVAMVAGIAALVWVYGATVRHEERYLLKTHGDVYREYMSRVPRFFPSRGMNAAERISRFKAGVPEGANPGSMAVGAEGEAHRPPSRMLWREAYTGLGFLLAGAAAMGLQHAAAWLQEEGWLPVLVRLGGW